MAPKNLDKLSPMMRQYMQIKQQQSDCLLMYRLGDFYELFFDDAILVSKELELTLTGRDCGLEERAPMCGVPYHALDTYLNRLTQKGYKVAICEQLTDPKESKGIVERDVVRIVSPGTVTSAALLDESSNNYLMSVVQPGESYGCAFCDVTTGEFGVNFLQSEEALSGELARISPSEIICPKAIKAKLSKLCPACVVYEFGDWAFEAASAKSAILEHFKTATLDGFGITDMSECVSAAGALISYLIQTQKNALSHINNIKVVETKKSMTLDAVTRKNLELTTPIRGSGKKGTLFGLLDKTATAMGARELKAWINAPLYDAGRIEYRLSGVEELTERFTLRDELRDALDGIYDISRLCSKIVYKTINAKDALALKESCRNLPEIKRLLQGANSAALLTIQGEIDPMQDIFDLLERAISEDPAPGILEGGIIKEGYNDDVDRLRRATGMSRQYLSELEQREREATGIKNLKIGYNKVFGYYFEITKSYLNMVPFGYVRKQTLSNCERFINQELKNLETDLLGAHDKLIGLEYELFMEVRRVLEGAIERIQGTCDGLCALDCLQSLATAAQNYGYCKPTITEDGELEIKGGRHPVVERGLSGSFVQNDTKLDCEDNRLAIITGPNMAGKSTYMRQVALIVLMAHIGSFVSASSATIPLTDRIFTRVGASDDLSSGQSTFMVEMSETANILNNATQRSLILLDEIGRGTSTFDGLSIAWAVCEYIADKQKLGAKTLFATHYHELSDLEGLLPGVVCYRITAREMGEEIVFLRQIVRGGTDKSFGIQVARLAGVPGEVVKRAKEILLKLEAAEINKTMQKQLQTEQASMFLNFNPEHTRLIKILRDMDINSMTPVDALSALFELQKLV